jgi:hypothetical protein
MAASLRIERSAKGLIKPIWLPVKQRINKMPVLGHAEIDCRLAIDPLELINSALKWMALSLPPQSHLCRAIDPNDQHSTTLETTAKVEQQVDRAKIGPLEVVNRQKQGAPLGNGANNAGVLLEEGALLKRWIDRPCAG